MFIPLSHPPPTTPLERLARIIDGLCFAIAARGPGWVLTAPLLCLLCGRLRRIAARATRAAARIAGGAPPAAARQRTAAPRPSRPHPPRLPGGFAWVARLVPCTAAYGAHLQALLADPLMAPLLAVPSVRRLLNPLCQMLGVPRLPPPPSSRPASAARPSARTRQPGGSRAAHVPPPSVTPVAAVRRSAMAAADQARGADRGAEPADLPAPGEGNAGSGERHAATAAPRPLTNAADRPTGPDERSTPATARSRSP